MGRASAAWLLAAAMLLFPPVAEAATIYLDDFAGSGDGDLSFGAFSSGGPPATDYWEVGDESTLSLIGGVTNSSPGNQFLGIHLAEREYQPSWAVPSS